MNSRKGALCTWEVTGMVYLRKSRRWVVARAGEDLESPPKSICYIQSSQRIFQTGKIYVYCKCIVRTEVISYGGVEMGPYVVRESHLG